VRFWHEADLSNDTATSAFEVTTDVKCSTRAFQLLPKADMDASKFPPGPSPAGARLTNDLVPLFRVVHISRE
jgi:hypothetical protein